MRNIISDPYEKYCLLYSGSSPGQWVLKFDVNTQPGETPEFTLTSAGPFGYFLV